MSNRKLIDEAKRLACVIEPIGHADALGINILRRLAAALEAQEWQPRDTCPTDGCVLLFNDKDGAMQIVDVGVHEVRKFSTFTHWKREIPPETEA